MTEHAHNDLMDRLDGDRISGWASQLGLAMSPLFGSSSSPEQGFHYALLDGRSGSFACSVGEVGEISPDESRNWQWSADLAHHVLVSSSDVRVRSGRDSASRRFALPSVEQHLADFFKFLETPRSGALPDVVPFLITEFLQIWNALPGERPQGHAALSAFLVAVIAAGEPDSEVFGDSRWRHEKGIELGFDEDDLARLDDLQEGVIIRGAKLRTRAPLGLEIVPDLVLRHAGGRLFQEAHAYLESAQYNFFGESLVSTVPTFSPSGAYFTPLPLARSVAESALKRWDVFPDELTIADLACGSAVFLTEALRVLERRGYKGTVRLVGRDISPEAVTMAKVAIAAAKRDLAEINVVADIARADAFRMDEWPQVDVILMNPPFRSWEQMTPEQREWVRSVLAGTVRGRPDLSVGFAERALNALKPTGVMAMLLPAGVLASEGLAPWRDSLLERSIPDLVAVLGEHGLFRHATVNVALLILQKKSNDENQIDSRKFEVAWASNEPGASSEALRAIRRFNAHVVDAAVPKPKGRSPSWSVTQMTVESWRQRPSWLPGPGALGSLLDDIRDSIPTRVESLFSVHQGIRTGANDIFLLSKSRFTQLPRVEQRYFRPAVETESFNEGEIKPRTFLFVPLESWETVAEVKAAMPIFFREVLGPASTALQARKGLARPERWWELTRVRKWSFLGTPRLVSKRFGLYPAFARDFNGNLAVVQANAWVPMSILAPKRDIENSTEELRDLLTAYWWMLNSRVMVTLFREFCPNVAGGQLDLEHKYVRHIPLPDLRIRIQSDPSLQAIAMEIRERNGDGLPSLVERDRFAAAAYGTNLSDWPIGSVRLRDADASTP